MSEPDSRRSEVIQSVDALCREFEAAWLADKRPDIGVFLDRVEDEQKEPLLDVAQRRRFGDTPLAAQYKARFPEYAQVIDEALGSEDTQTKSLAVTTPYMVTPPDLNQSAAQVRTKGRENPSLDRVIKSLTDSGLMSREEVEAFLNALPASSRPKDGKELAEALYRQKKLTRFQAQAVYQGKTRGLVVGNYVVLDKIGRGGMGQVYKARHRVMERIVALKVLTVNEPDAQVEVLDSQRRVQASYRTGNKEVSIQLASGDYRVLVEKPGFERSETAVTITPDADQPIAVTLAAAKPAEVTAQVISSVPEGGPVPTSMAATQDGRPAAQVVPAIPDDLASRESIDLLAIVRTGRDTVQGNWSLNGHLLTAPRTDLISVLAIPCKLPDQYVMTMIAERIAGIDGLGLMLPFGSRRVEVHLDGWPHNGTWWTGLHMIDGQNGNDNSTRREGCMLPNGKRTTIRAMVHDEGVAVECNGELLIQWKGNPSQVLAGPFWDSVPEHVPGLRSHMSSFRIHELKITPLTGEAEPIAIAGDHWWRYGSHSAARDELTAMGRDGRQQLSQGEWVDVLKYLDPGADVSYAQAALDNGSLVLKSGHPHQVRLPVLLDGDYDLEVTFTRLAGTDAVFLNLPVATHPCGVILSSGSPPRSGIELLGGKGLDVPKRAAVVENGHLENGHRYTALTEVRTSGDRATVRLVLDGHQLFSWSGSVDDLAVKRYWWIGYPLNRLMVGNWGTVVQFHSIRVRPISGKTSWYSPSLLPQSPYVTTPALANVQGQ